MSQLLIGITLLVAGVAMIVVSAPRAGKTAWFVGNQFLEPLLPIIFIAVCVIGLIEVAAYFTDFGGRNFER